MRMFWLALLLVLASPLTLASPLVASDIQVFAVGISSPVESVALNGSHALERIDVLVKNIQSGSACVTLDIGLEITQVNSGISALINPPRIASTVAPIPNFGETQAFSFFQAAGTNPPPLALSNLSPDNYRIQATVYCDSSAVHQSAEIIAVFSDSGPISVPEFPPVIGFLIALAVCTALFGIRQPNFID